MSNDRPRGSYNGPLSLQWCAYSMTVRAMPMNYLAADLSRIDAALWGRESEIGTAIAEAPAMMQRLFYLVDAVDEFERNPTAGTQSMLRSRAKAARAILSRIDGAGDTLPDMPEPAPTGEERARPRTQWALTIIRKNWEPRFSVYPTEEDVRLDLLGYAREVLDLEVSDLADIAELADRIGEDGRDQVYWGPAGPC